MQVEIYAAVEVSSDGKRWGCAMRAFLHDPLLAPILAASGRGLPPGVSPKSLAEDPFYADDELARLGAPRTCTVATADEWVRAGVSLRIDADRVSDPELHSFTWLTSQELIAVASTYAEKGGRLATADLAALISFLQTYEEHERDVRLVVCLEN